MKLCSYNIIPVFEVLLILCVIKTICGRMFGEDGFYPAGYYESQQAQQREKIKIALNKLENAPEWVSNWPNPNIKLGQVSGLAIDNAGRLLVFHRANHQWDATTFNEREVYNFIATPAIKDPTIIVLNDTGEVVDQWGQNLFYMPHGITVDREDNVWVTDVAMHQVLKFTPNDKKNPALVLGERFIPGEDNKHFCKPSAVAVLANGDFFVADGYCNHRILKFSSNGSIILQWGTSHGSSHFRFNVPHALTLAEDRGLVCVADRERGRVGCFRHDNGSYVSSFSSWLIGGRLFSVAYAPVHGGRLYVVNGPAGQVPVRGYVIDFTTGRLIQTFAPENDLRNPHDIVTSPDGSKVYVAELSPYKVHKFVDEELRNESLAREKIHVKPTATVGRKGVTRRRWEYGHGEFKLRRLLERRRFTRVHSDDSDEEPAPMLPPHAPPANA